MAGDIADIINMAEKAKKLAAFLGVSSAEDKKRRVAKPPPVKPPAIKSDGIINAAIPFLDKEYQKGIYIALRLIEINRALNNADLAAMSNESDSAYDNRRKMLLSIRPQLEKNEREKLDILLKAMEMKQLILISKQGGKIYENN